MERIYPEYVSDQLTALAGLINAKVATTGVSIKDLAVKSNLTVSSVKSILGGKTANIASYLMVLDALGSSLIEACQLISSSQDKEAL